MTSIDAPTSPTTSGNPALTKRLQEAAEPKGTAYVVLKLDDRLEATGVWFEAGRCHAALSAEQAIRTIATDGNLTGTFVAIPARSWKPLTVKVETVPKITIESA